MATNTPFGNGPFGTGPWPYTIYAIAGVAQISFAPSGDIGLTWAQPTCDVRYRHLDADLAAVRAAQRSTGAGSVMLQRVFTRVSKGVARYTGAGSVAEHCSACRFFMAGGACARVLGPISPQGWCKFFSREAVASPLWPILSGLPLPAGSTLNLDFIGTPGTLDPRITFTRASTATYFNSAGTMQTATANTPRWDYDPVTHALRGLFMEEARTNSLLNSATLGTQSVAVTAQAYTLSFYGTGTITKSGTASGALVGTGATQRVSQTFTPTAGTLTCTVTGSVTNAQLEAGAFVTSYIPTTGAAATRAADSASMPYSSFITNPLAISYSVQAMMPVSGAGLVWIAIDDGTANNRSVLSTDAPVNLRYFEASGGATTSNTTAAASLSIGVVFKAAASSTSGLQSMALNGVWGGGWNSAVNPPVMTALHPGSSGIYTSGSGYIQRINYWPRALSVAELQQVTT